MSWRGQFRSVQQYALDSSSERRSFSYNAKTRPYNPEAGLPFPFT